MSQTQTLDCTGSEVYELSTTVQWNDIDLTEQTIYKYECKEKSLNQNTVRISSIFIE